MTLIKGAPILCPYCDHEYRPANYTLEGVREALKLHIAECSKHPTHQLLKVLKAGRDLLVSEPSLGLHADAWVNEATTAIAAAEPAKPKRTRRKS